MNKQPRAFILLFFVQMWERFSFYGMRALLPLYLIQVQGLADGKAFAVYAIYSVLVKMGGLAGGQLSDRLLGQRQAILIGGWVIALGHICMMSEAALFLGLALIAVGTSLFSGNLLSLLGLFYEGEDPRREQGFTYFYMGINLGSVISSFLCAYIAYAYGWHYGFGLAAVGMIAGILTFAFSGKLLEGKGAAPVGKSPLGVYLGLAPATLLALFFLKVPEYLTPFVPFLCLGLIAYGLRQVPAAVRGKLAVTLVGFILFFAIEEMSGSSLIVFAEKFTVGQFMPASALTGLNPLMVVLGGFIVSRLTIAGEARMTLGFALAALAFAGLGLSALSLPTEASVALAIMLVAAGEVFIGPYVYATFAKHAPKEKAASMMALVPLGLATAASLSGLIGQGMASPGEGMEGYLVGFAAIALVLALYSTRNSLLRLVRFLCPSSVMTTVSSMRTPPSPGR